MDEICTNKSALCPGASLKEYSPLTNTPLCISSFRHRLLLAGNLNIKQFTMARIHKNKTH